MGCDRARSAVLVAVGGVGVSGKEAGLESLEAYARRVLAGTGLDLVEAARVARGERAPEGLAHTGLRAGWRAAEREGQR